MRSARTKLPGHPDKACDLVAEAIVDEYLKRDPETRIQVHVTGGRGAIFVCGDVRSQADFDVAALVHRTLGSLGLVAEMEPFVALEAVSPQQTERMLNGLDLPVTVTGYATDETPELLPKTLAASLRAAKAIEDKRQGDENWFWVGADGEVEVSASGSEPDSMHIVMEHGTFSLADAREQVVSLMGGILPELKVRINELGPQEARSLVHSCGASGKHFAAYGHPLPPVDAGIGRDIHHPTKAGAWLARATARKLVAAGAKAALVSAVYMPGEKVPSKISARDGQGKDLSSQINPHELNLTRVAKEWWRPGLNFDAARWGFAGQTGLPWEV